MSNKFDPMTGERIFPQEEIETDFKFDPMTGEPIQPAQAPQPAMSGFDPMTGQPIQPAQAPQPAMGGFDPMTGQPIQPAQAPQPAMGGFDPMTGQPLQPVQAPQPAMSAFDPMTGQPISPAPQMNIIPAGPAPVKKKKLALFLSLLVVGIILIGSALAVVATGAFSTKVKLNSIIKRTFKETPYIYRDMDFQNISKLLSSDNYTIDFDTRVREIDFDMQMSYAKNKDRNQIDFRADIADLPESLDTLVEIGSGELKASSSHLRGKYLAYNYQGFNSGYITELDEENILPKINRLLQNFDEGKVKEDLTVNIQNAFTDELNKVDVTSIPKRNFIVDGDMRLCAGYEVYLSPQFFNRMLDEWERTLRNYLNDLSFYTDNSREFRDILDELEYVRDEFYSKMHFKINFFSYKNKLAAIELIPLFDNPHNVTVEILFECGDYRMQNMSVISKENGRPSEAFHMEGYFTGNRETLRFYEEYYDYYKEELFSIDYDRGSGNISLVGEDFSMRLILESKKNFFKIQLLDFRDYYDESAGVTGSFSIHKNGFLKDFIGEKIDIGNIGEDEFIDLVEGFYDLMDFYY